jgi:hypothetical protein
MCAVLTAVLLAWLFGGAAEVPEPPLPREAPSKKEPEVLQTTLPALAEDTVLRSGAVAGQKLILAVTLGMILVGLCVDWWNTWRRKTQLSRAANEVVRLAEVRGGPALGHLAGEQPDQKLLVELLGKAEGIDAAIRAVEQRVTVLQSRARDAGRAIQNTL